MEGPLLRPLPFWRQRSGGLTMGQAGNDSTEGRYHEPVLVTELVELVRPVGSGVVLDATFGGGGHTRALLRALPDATVLGIDRDPEAGERPVGPRATLVRADYRELSRVLRDEEVPELAAGVFDLGVSSRQLDEPGRGFSYRERGPLDMRMGPDARITADDVVNSWDEDDIARIIRRYGEDRYARRIAAGIVRARPLGDTLELAEAVAGAVPAAARRKAHPARRTFQAIRIAVNDELDGLRRGLDAAIAALRPGGRIAVISYHSLEDRIVKQRFTTGAAGCVCPPDLPVCACGRPAELRLLTRKPIRPSEAEVDANPRARSARLRAAERIEGEPA